MASNHLKCQSKALRNELAEFSFGAKHLICKILVEKAPSSKARVTDTYFGPSTTPKTQEEVRPRGICNILVFTPLFAKKYAKTAFY